MAASGLDSDDIAAEILRLASARGTEVGLADALVDLASSRHLGRASIWLLSRRSGGFWAADNRAKARWGDNELSARTARSLEEWADVGALGTLAPELETMGFRRGTAIYTARRGGTAVGLVILENPQVGESPERFQRAVRELSLGVIAAYERAYIQNLLRVEQLPLNLRLNSADFFTSLAVDIARSTQMELVAIREHDAEAGAFKTLAVHGFSRGRPNQAYDLAPAEAYVPFWAAFSGESVAISDANDDALGPLRAMQELDEVQSFLAAPLKVDGVPFGVLSAASKYAYQYSRTELLSFASLANRTSTAIGYYRSAQREREQLLELAETAAAFTGIEVAAAVRHDSKLRVANVKDAVANVRTALANKNVALATERLTHVGSTVDRLFLALDQLRLVTLPPKRKAELVDLSVLLADAERTAGANLSLADVTFRPHGPKVLVMVYRDWFRQVLVNLILNSLDAYGPKRRSSRSGAERVIQVIWDAPAAGENEVRIRYSDKGPGLQVGKLLDHLEPGARIESRLFDKGVSSKKDGTGYGLWLCRQIMSEHGGSIDLTDHKDGMTFVLRLPTPDHSPLAG